MDKVGQTVQFAPPQIFSEQTLVELPLACPQLPAIIPDMFSFLTFGIVLGISAGLSPGPLMTLIISQTLRHGLREGLKVAIAPLITDLPIVICSWLIMTRIAQVDFLLGVMSLVGAVFLLFLSRGSWRAESPDIVTAEVAPRSIVKGALVNFLSPNPYLFWISVGAPTLVRARTLTDAAGFLAGFYLFLVGGKLFVAWVAGRYRHSLNRRTYHWVMRGLAAMLVLFALFLIRDGIRLIGK